MKESFERLVKQQLDSYEMPYENGAWEQFAKRLDGTPSTPFYRKWWFAASIGTVLVGSATYFALSANDRPVADPVAQQPVAAQTAKPEAPAQQQPTIAANNDAKNSAPATSVQPQENPRAYTWNPAAAATPAEQQTPQSLQVVNDQTNHTPTPAGTEGSVPNKPRLAKFEAPATICLNESFTVKNPNDAAITVTMPNGKTRTIAGKQSADIKASEAGRITLHTTGQTEIVLVNEAVSNLIIDIDASLLYENGIPTLKFNVLNAEHAVTWTTNVNPLAQSFNKSELTVHPYHQRDVKVTAHSTDQNGCPVSEQKIITLEKVYNLLAPTGFNPSSADDRTNRFIPYALKERDTPFEMVIMDAKTMTVVYRTTDASQGWDGVDSRNGQLAAPGSTWLWKVTLKSPLPGEQNEYSGLVTTKRVD